MSTQSLAAGCIHIWPTLCLALQKANVSSVKYQVCRLIRMLVHICKTLDSMPAEVCRACTAAFPNMSFASIDANTKFLGFATFKLLCMTQEAASNAAEVSFYEADIL